MYLGKTHCIKVYNLLSCFSMYICTLKECLGQTEIKFCKREFNKKKQINASAFRDETNSMSIQNKLSIHDRDCVSDNWVRTLLAWSFKLILPAHILSASSNKDSLQTYRGPYPLSRPTPSLSMLDILPTQLTELTQAAHH